MRLPNADLAVIDDAKVRDYLLSPTHPVGRFKSVFFVALGFTPDRWQALRDDLLELARTGEALPGQHNPFGLKFEIRTRSANRVVTACIALSQARGHGRAKAEADARGARGMGEASRAVA